MPSPPELLPLKALFAEDERVRVEVRGLQSAEHLAAGCLLAVTHLGDAVTSVPVEVDADVDPDVDADVDPDPVLVDLGTLPVGGYAVSLESAGVSLARSAVQVVGADRRRTVLRYGFVASYQPGREVADVQDSIRRLHLTGIQFYDWAYRHADLMGGGEDYVDALGNAVSLATVRTLVDACHEVGADALGYAAVYAVGGQEWPRWSEHALLSAAGTAYALGDFLRLLNPAAPPWWDHLTGDLAAAYERVGFDGFHLDQYGYPKTARTADGTLVRVSDSFVTVINQVRRKLPRSRLVFNNVNDFPTWATARTAQDAVYVELWEPHVGYGDLAAVVTRARTLAGERPVVVAAYQSVYDSAPTPEADQATALTMATLFSHGATHLLCGEADRILVDPYYVRNHIAGPSTTAMLRRWYDFLVAHDELLMAAGVVDVTGSYAGAYNGDLDVTYPEVQVRGTPVPGTVWRRVTAVGDRLVVHLVNLSGQSDTRWDGPHAADAPLQDGRLRVRLGTPQPPLVRVADPDGAGTLQAVAVSLDGEYAEARLPALRTWQLVVVEQR